MTRSLRVAAILMALSVPAAAQELPPQFGRYMPLYPGLYLNGGYATDERDASYDQRGDEHDSAAPQAGGQTAFPEKSVAGAFTWHFPMFESQGLSFLSSRTHLARVTLRYVDTETTGRLAEYAADDSDDATTDADGLANSGKGVGDTTLEFGSFLWGTRNWRTREVTPLAVLLLLGVNAPTGTYEHEAPNNPGSNQWTFQGKLGVHWQPWRGGFIDAAWAYRAHSTNYEPEFGGLAPYNQGDDRLWDVSVAQRVFPGLYVTAFATDRRGEPNHYRNPRYAPNAPEAPPPDPGFYSSRNFPNPGTYEDDGTALRSYGAALQYFLTQRWLAAVHYTAPQSGKSGQFELPFTNRQCTVAGGTSSSSCTDSDAGSVVVDGMGPARSYASDRLMVTLTYNFGLGDTFTCTGCTR